MTCKVVTTTALVFKCNSEATVDLSVWQMSRLNLPVLSDELY